MQFSKNKKLIAILCLIIKFSLQQNKVILFAIDGLNPSCIHNASSNSSFQWLQQQGSWTHKARTSIQAVSAPCWGSIFCSQQSESTGILDNNWEPSWVTGKQNKLSAFYNQPFTCIFEQIKKQNRFLQTLFYYDWDWFQNIGNKVFGQYIDDEIFCSSENLNQLQQCENENILIILEKIEKYRFNFMTIYFNLVDETGHAKSWCGIDQEQAIGFVNEKIQQVLNSLEKSQQLKDTSIFIISDHGGRPGDFQHGFQNDDNINIPFYAYGPNIRKAHEIEGQVLGIDIAPMIVNQLGILPHNSWRGHVIESILQPEPNCEVFDFDNY